MEDDRSEIVFFDVETTIPSRPGQGYALLEFGAILVCPRKLVELASYSTLIRPTDPSLISTKSERCNGIARDNVASAPSFSVIADQVFSLLHGRIWAGHNILRFDCPRVQEAFAEIGRLSPEPKGTIDTLPLLTERFGRRAGDMKMATLASYFGLGRQSHRSLDDVRMNLEVVKCCATVLFLNTTIHATLDSRLLKIFKEGTVVEGMAYRISRFSIGLNNYSNKVTNHKMRLYFEAGTSITKVTESSIPRNKFNVVSFNDIIHHNVDTSEFIDVIAVVVNFNEVVVTKKGITYTTINLRDKDGDDLVCVVWGCFSKIVQAICVNCKNDPLPPILSIQYVKRWVWNDQDCITTNRGCTRFILNPELPQAVELRTWLDADLRAGKSLKMTISASETNGLFARPDLKCLKEIIDSKKAGIFLTVVTITELPRRHAWYFNSCNKCRNKCVRGYAGDWLCTNNECSGYITPMKSSIPRFLVVFGVQGQDAECAEIQLFDNHISSLVKESASDLLDKNRESPTTEAFPAQLLVFLDKEVVVKLKVSREHNLDKNSKCFGVKSLSFSPTDIAKWKDMYKEQMGKGKGVMQTSVNEIEPIQSSVESSSHSEILSEKQAKKSYSMKRASSTLSISSEDKQPESEAMKCMRIMAIKKEKM